MRNVLAIARLTFREGVRMRIVLVFVILLAFIMLWLPFTVRGDQTVTGQLQTFLSYSLGAVGLLLGLATVFLSCSTLTAEFRSMTLHLVLTKPVSRVEVLAGKWLGINALMLLLLGLSGATIYGFAVLIKNRPANFERDKLNVRDVVWQARVAAEPKLPPEFREQAREWVESELKQGHDFSRGKEFAIAQRMKELETEWRKIPPSRYQLYDFDGLIAPRDADTVIQIRFRAAAKPSPLDEMLPIDFAFVDPETRTQMGEMHHTRERINTRHQFLARGQGVIKNGRAALLVGNPLPPDGRLSIAFDQDQWLELLYQIGSFEENYLKVLLLIIGRLAILSAVGLLFSVFVSFPVACFCVLTFYVICLGMPFWLEAVGANMELQLASADPYGRFGPFVRLLLVPFMKFAFPNFAVYGGTDQLIEGEYISTALVLKAMVHTAVYGAVLLFLPGWVVFQRREVADVVVN
jgi:ABC-type transport system involved in multi-copper enzyme maturation permease subunit